MDDDELSEHLDIMRSGGFVLDREEFVHLKSWHGVLFQAVAAKFALSKLKFYENKNGDLINIHEQLAMFGSSQKSRH